jgi:hypothetical protein
VAPLPDCKKLPLSPVNLTCTPEEGVEVKGKLTVKHGSYVRGTGDVMSWLDNGKPILPNIDGVDPMAILVANATDKDIVLDVDAPFAMFWGTYIGELTPENMIKARDFALRDFIKPELTTIRATLAPSGTPVRNCGDYFNGCQRAVLIVVVLTDKGWIVLNYGIASTQAPFYQALNFNPAMVAKHDFSKDVMPQ